MVSSRRGEGLIFPKARRPCHTWLCQPVPCLRRRQPPAGRPARHTRAHAAPRCRSAAARTLMRRAALRRAGGRRTKLQPKLRRAKAWRRRACAVTCRRAAPRRATTKRVAGAAGAARLSAFPLASGFGQLELTFAPHPGPPARQELGSFRFTSKTHRCVAHVFVMRVTEVRAPSRRAVPVALAHAISTQELAVWPERHERQREWVRCARAHRAWLRLTQLPRSALFRTPLRAAATPGCRRPCNSGSQTTQEHERCGLGGFRSRLLAPQRRRRELRLRVAVRAPQPSRRARLAGFAIDLCARVNLCALTPLRRAAGNKTTNLHSATCARSARALGALEPHVRQLSCALFGGLLFQSSASRRESLRRRCDCSSVGLHQRQRLLSLEPLQRLVLGIGVHNLDALHRHCGVAQA